MPTINSVQEIVATIRARMVSQVGAGGKHENTQRVKQHSKADANALAEKKMNALIGRRVKAIKRDDPKRGNKVFRIFLESVLLSEFGEGLINDPGFYTMVGDIQQAMEADPELSNAIDKAIVVLLDPQTNHSSG